MLIQKFKIVILFLSLFVISICKAQQKDTLTLNSDSIFKKYLSKNYIVIKKKKILDSTDLFDSFYRNEKIFYSKNRANRQKWLLRIDDSYTYIDSVFKIDNHLLISGEHLGFARHSFIIIFNLITLSKEIYYIYPENQTIAIKIKKIRSRINW